MIASLYRLVPRALCIPLCLLYAATAAAAGTTPVLVFHAGSLSLPLAQMEKEFEAANPDLDIVLQGGGSTKMARMISEEGKEADIMASADYSVIDKTLIPGHARWNIRFATNQLVLCYTDKSRYADQINATNWPEILEKDDVVWGHSEPNLDPCGYRSLMVLQLAEIVYNRPGLYERLLANRPLENVRPKAVELVELLKSGAMDYAWEYLSVAKQHQLNYLTLDDRINLGNYEQDAFYSQAKVDVTGKDPGSMVTQTGKSITYGITMLDRAPNPEGAARFLSYMLSGNGGLQILDAMGQPPFIPCRVPNKAMAEMLPREIASLVVVAE